MTQATRIVKSSELNAGMVVHFYGARFKLRDNRKETHREGDESVTVGITGDWLDGNVVTGYFGPTKPWWFQGNDFASWKVEV